MISRAKNVVLALSLCLGSAAIAQEASSPTPTPTPQANTAESAERRAERAQQRAERDMQRAQRLAEQAQERARVRVERIGPMSALRVGPPGKWWSNPEMAQKLGITKEQQGKMDDIFQQSRLKLIDLNASLQKEEAILEPLVESDQPDENKILAQIDRVAQARAELEKANARMLLGLRRVLTPDQWEKLRAETPGPGRFGIVGPGGMALQIHPGEPVPPIPPIPPMQ